MTVTQIFLMIETPLLLLAGLYILYMKIGQWNMKEEMENAKFLLEQHAAQLDRCLLNIRHDMEVVSALMDGGKTNGLGSAVQGWTGQILASRGIDPLPRKNLRLNDPSKGNWADCN